MDISTQVSRKFRLISTYSMVAVVFIHAKFIMSRWDACMNTDTAMGKISDIVQFSISEQICRLAVPLFFLISGFFMAYHNDGSFKQYLSKVRDRVKSLLVPYLLFSIIWLVISILAGRIELNNIRDFIIHSFVSPVPFQFWFLQHLMVLVLVSVLLYYLIKRFGFLMIAVFGVIYLLDSDIHGGIAESVFYYSLGICLCIKPFFVKYGKAFAFAFFALFITCAVVRFLEFDLEYGIYCVVSKSMIFCGVCWFIWWILENKCSFDAPKWLTIGSSTSFFIFCTHEPMLSFLKSIFLHIFSTQYEIFIGYLFLPLLTISLCLIADYLVKKMNINVYGILTGGR